jgi:hypothetical protein
MLRYGERSNSIRG